MSLRHLIDGQPMVDPLDWKSFEGELHRDFGTRIISEKFPSTAKWGGAGYKMLRSMYVSDMCRIVDYEVYDNCGGYSVRVVKAKIILADCDWNVSKCTVECSMVDDGVGARINNNRKIPIDAAADRTKNLIPQAATSEIDVAVFDPEADLATYLPTRRMVDWFDAIAHAIGYITDGHIEVQSAWYNALPTNERWAITTGYQLRTADTSDSGLRLVYSFDDLFAEVAKKYDLWIVITRNTQGEPVVNIEPQEDTYAPTAFALYEQDDLQQYMDTERLWAKVIVGSESGLPNLNLGQSLPFLILQGFSEEEFHFTGVCNTDAELDLVSKWGICTNLIEAVLNGDEGIRQDGNIFLIQYDSGTLQAVKGDYFNAGDAPYLYNEAMLNINVLNRYTLPSNIGVYFNSAEAEFLAERTDAVVNDTVEAIGTMIPFPNQWGAPTGTPSQFDNDYSAPGFDPSNSYGNGTTQGTDVAAADSIYAAPSQGYFEFHVSHLWSISENRYPPALPGYIPCHSVAQSRIVLRAKDSGGNLLWDEEFVSPQEFVEGDYQHDITFPVVLNAGDTVEVFLLFRRGFLTYTSQGPNYCEPSTLVDGEPNYRIRVNSRAGSTFSTEFVAAGGGTITSADPGASRVVKYEFERHLPASTWKALTDDPKKGVGVSPNEYMLRNGHALRITRNLSTGMATIELIVKRSEPL